MKLRNGFVSNSSSCSFILVLPEDKEILSKKRAFSSYFGLDSMFEEETEKLRRAIVKIYEEGADCPLDSNYGLVVRYIGEMVSRDGWIKTRAEDPRDFSYSPKDYEEYKKEMNELLSLLQDRGKDLLFMEVGDSYEYQEPYLNDSLMIEDLSIESRAKKMITKNCYIFNNR